MRLKKRVAPVLLIVLFGALLIQLPLAIADRAGAYEWFDPIIDVRRILMDAHVEPPDEPKMQQAMINAMLETLDDPYTMYVPPASEQAFNKELRGRYVGIGAEVNMVDNYLTIVTAMDDSPALEAGVQAGDIVLEIEGTSTMGLTIDQCIEKLMGEPGTPVRIRVRHLDGAEQELSIIRRQIVQRTVKGIFRDGEDWNYCVDASLGIGYVRISQFSDETMRELGAAFSAIQKRGLNALVLDLRDDPGGELPTAIAVADLFLQSGDIVAIRGRSGPGSSWSAKAEGTLPDFPMVVLVNGNSASASEIVAGALQDNGRAKVLGARTYGKGSVQEVRPLPVGPGTIKVTTAYYYLPSGRNIHRKKDSTVWGVDPDPGYVVAVSDEAHLAMLRARRDFEVIRNGRRTTMTCANLGWVRETLLDEQLARAIEALQARLAGKDWPRVGEDAAAVTALAQERQRVIAVRSQLREQIAKVDERLRELSELSTTAGEAPLLPPTADLVDSTVTVRDRHGNVVGVFRLGSTDLETALRELRATPADPLP